MNEEQKKWTNAHCKELKIYLEQSGSLTDAQSEVVIGYIDVIVALSKGNEEVRNALFDVIEPYQIRAEKEKKNG